VFRILDVVVALDPRSLTIVYASFAAVYLAVASSIVLDRDGRAENR
jgi:hypothetical protein